MTGVIIATTALFLHELRGCRRVASELSREAKGIWCGTQKWDLFWLEYRLFCFDYWGILISASKARLTFASQFSCPPQGMWVSSSVVLSCWLGLNHNTPKNRVGNEYWFSYSKIAFLANFKCLWPSICCLVWLMYIIILGLERNFLRTLLSQWTPHTHCVQSPHCVLLRVPALVYVQSFECHSIDENSLVFDAPDCFQRFFAIRAWGECSMCCTLVCLFHCNLFKS